MPRIEFLLVVTVLTICIGLILLGPSAYRQQISSPLGKAIEVGPEVNKIHISAVGPTHLAILCLERSGSTWLTAMLNNNKGIHLLAEPLVPLAGPKNKDPVLEVSAANEFKLLTTSVDKIMEEHGPTLSVIGFNEKFISPKYALPSTAVILKEFEIYLRNRDYRVIVLIRKNIVYQAVSMIRAVQLAERCGSAGWSKVSQEGWNSLCGPAHEEIAKRDIPIPALRENIQIIRDKNSQLLEVTNKMQYPFLLIYYEDLYENPNRTMLQISEWIGHDVRPTDTLYVKQGSVALWKTLPNYLQIQSYLRKNKPCLVEHLFRFNPSETCS